MELMLSFLTLALCHVLLQCVVVDAENQTCEPELQLICKNDGNCVWLADHRSYAAYANWFDNKCIPRPENNRNQTFYCDCHPDFMGPGCEPCEVRNEQMALCDQEDVGIDACLDYELSTGKSVTEDEILANCQETRSGFGMFYCEWRCQQAYRRRLIEARCEQISETGNATITRNVCVCAFC